MSTQTPIEDNRRTQRVVGWILLVAALLLILLLLGKLLWSDDTGGTAGPAPSATPTASGTLEPSPTQSPEPTPSTTGPAPTPAPGQPGGGSSGSGGGSTSPGGRPFTMTAALTSGTLSPGVTRTLRIVVSNPNASALEIQQIDVSVGAPGNAGCLASWVSVGNFRIGSDPRTVVPGHGTRQITVPIKLVNLAATNQNACKNTTFPLRLSGSARQVAG